MGRLGVFLMISAIVLLVDIYVFYGIKHLIRRWTPETQIILKIAYWIISLAPIVILFIFGKGGKEHPSTDLLKWSSTFLFILFAGKLIWALFLSIDDFWRLIRWFSGKVGWKESPDLGRKNFLITTGALFAGGLMSALGYGIVKGAHNYRVRTRKIGINGISEALKGLKIVQISDIHSGSFWNKKAVQDGVNKINELQPDLIFFTGDLVNDKAKEFEGVKEIFSQLKAKYGIYSVLGNHDYGDYAVFPDEDGITKEQNLQNLIQHQTSMGWRLLNNENEVIEINGEKLAVIGVENWSAHLRFPKYGDLPKALENIPNNALKLLLSHDPSHWKAQVLKDFKDIAITFSGHTHGMQFGIDSKYYRWSPVQYQYKEWADLYQENNQYLYVNRGFGYIGYPGRVGFYPEITEIILV
jgi:predicted MPP superfamily phosphohydrolase